MRTPPGGRSFQADLNAGLKPLELRAEDDALADISSVLIDGGVVLLGETHGVEENAAVLHWFIRQFGPVQLGLEWGPRAGAVLREFGDGNPVDVSRLRPSADGRITPQHFCAFRVLVRSGLATNLVPFVPEAVAFPADDPSQNSWERALADRLLALRYGAEPTIVMAGSVHALVDPQPVRGRTRRRSVGASPTTRRLRPSTPSTRWDGTSNRAVRAVSVGIRYGKGSFTNFGTRQFRRDRAIAANRFRYRDDELTVEVSRPPPPRFPTTARESDRHDAPREDAVDPLATV